jgi:hypothetical protein
MLGDLLVGDIGTLGAPIEVEDGSAWPVPLHLG